MRTRRLTLLIALVGLAALVPTVFAGGWAVATLDEIPTGVVAGQPFTVSFTMRQHGVRPANWGTVPLKFTHTESRQTVVVTAEAEGSHYTVAVTLPETGTWEWLLGEGLLQPMPAVVVQAPAAAAPAVPAPSAGPPLAGLVAVAGLVSLGLGVMAVLRTRRPWAAALTVGAALVAALGFAWPPAAPAVSSVGEASAPADMEMGQALFLGKGCVMCHAHSAVAEVRRRTLGEFNSFSTGPDLSNFRASADYLRLWLADPVSVKPKAQMPDLGLTEAEIEALIGFLNAGTSAPAASCAVTATVRATPPDDPNADPFGDGPWLVNADRSLWADWAGGWTAGTNGNKVIWIRPAGTSLQIEGQRLDGEAPPLRAEIPGGYATGFQVSGLYFPTSGCWSVTATAGKAQLEFVVAIP